MQTHRCLSLPCRSTSQVMLVSVLFELTLLILLSLSTHVVHDVKFSHVRYLMQYFISAVH